MKKLSIILAAICLTVALQAAVTKTVHVATAGTLHSYFTTEERTTVTDLTLSGTIDARDFSFMRDTLTVLAKIDLSATNIAAYSGTGGTSPITNASYSENYLPQAAFGYINPSTRITEIILPTSIVSIDGGAFYNCNGLTSMTIPENVNSFSGLFSSCIGIREIHFKNPVPVPYDPIFYSENLHSRLGLEYQERINITVAVYVPEDAVNAYTASPDLGGWDYVNNQYIQIIGESAANNQEVSTNALITKRIGDQVVISGLTIGYSLNIYNLNGIIVYSQRVLTETLSIYLPKGLYIIQHGAYTNKQLF